MSKRLCPVFPAWRSARSTLRRKTCVSGSMRHSWISAGFRKLLRIPDTDLLMNLLREPKRTGEMRWRGMYVPYAEDLSLQRLFPRLCSILRCRICSRSVSYTHLRAHETRHDLVCR